MIILNKKFNDIINTKIIPEMLKPSFNSSTDYGNLDKRIPTVDMRDTNIANNTDGLLYNAGNINIPDNTPGGNLFIVTDKFLKTLDKVYVKIWNGSITGSYFYSADVTLATMYQTFFNGIIHSNFPGIENNNFPSLVDKFIAAGYLTEDDRLTQEDQIYINLPSAAVYNDTEKEEITITNSAPIAINIKAEEGDYLYGKKLYMFFTPFLKQTYNSAVAYNWSYFKAGDNLSRSNIPLPTHMIWSLGTPEEREIALLESKTGLDLPEVIFDHLDRVEYIDNFQLKINFSKITI